MLTYPKALLRHKELLLFCLLLLFLLCNLWDLMLGKAASGLMQGDGAAWPYITDYFSQHLSFWPWPQLNLINNETFYPQGINHVFQAWCLEREYFYVVLQSLLGSGPWLSVYFFFSLCITGLGSYWLLLKHFGFWRRTSAALYLSIGHIYLLAKFPQHLNIAAAHWCILSLILDFLLMKSALETKKIRLNQVLLRCLLTMLCLGLDLSYIAAYSLTSLCFTAVFLAWHKYKHRWTYQAEPNTLSIVYLICILSLSWLYLPLLIQISYSAQQFDFTQVAPSNYWAMPLRFGLSYILPESWVNQITPFFGDNVESNYVLRPGLFLGLLALMAWPTVRKNIRLFAPLFLLTLLCLIYHPVLLPSLKIFPWFAFHRIGGRSSLIYPIVLVLMALHIPSPTKSSTRLILASILALGAIEMDMAYLMLWSQSQFKSIDPHFKDYLHTIKNLPGEALLEWPFCATGGNGVGLNELCPYFSSTNSLHTWRRLHQKKVMGQYFGRLHPSQIKAYLDTGWDQLYTPVQLKGAGVNVQSRCFNLQEWSFFDDFYRSYDFSALSLIASKVPSACVQEFIHHYGLPIARAEHPEAGLVLLFPRNQAWKHPQDHTSKNRPHYTPWRPNGSVNLVQEAYPEGLETHGLSQSTAKHRDSQGTNSQIIFRNQHHRKGQLRLKLKNIGLQQNIDIWLDQTLLSHFSLAPQEILTTTIDLDLKPGEHELRLEYGFYYTLNEIIHQHIETNKSLAILSPSKLKNRYKDLKNKSVRYLELSLQQE